VTANATYQLKTPWIAIASMREQQILYFRTESRDTLAHAKGCKARVDRVLSDLQRAAEGPSPASDQAR
jgi:hypothetical protein